MQKDVVVIGAGPAGATVASGIAKAGFGVLVLEKEESPGKGKVCGGALSKDEFLQLQIQEQIVEREVHKIVVHLGAERMELPSKRGFVLFYRDKFDSALMETARKNGAELVTYSIATDVSTGDYGAVIHYKHLSHEELKVSSKLVIFADGANTLANKTLRIGFNKDKDLAMLAAVYEIKNKGELLESLDFFVSSEISPFGYGWVFPKRDSINIGVACLLTKLKCNIKEHLDKLLASQNIQSDVITFGCRLIPQSIVEKIHCEAAMVVGDAAGTADPITGDGISNAIANGKIASEIAIQALEAKDLTAASLAEYDRRWQESETYRRIVSKYKLQESALKIGINPALSVVFGAFTGSMT